jgi:hypothetical protein
MTDMRPKRWRPGIRPQLTIIVLLAAVLSTVATLIVTELAINNNINQQGVQLQQEHAKVAKLVLSSNFGQNISIASNGAMVADSPGSNGSFADASSPTGPYPYGKYPLNNDTDYVDLVGQLIGGQVSVYQCVDTDGNPLKVNGQPTCERIASTITSACAPKCTTAPREVSTAQKPVMIEPGAVANMGLRYAKDPTTGLSGWTGHEWPQVQTNQPPTVNIDGTVYFADYSVLLNPQQQIIGVLFVGVPYEQVAQLVSTTTTELVIVGIVVMLAGALLAIFVASRIVGTLQRAARQVSGASERFGAIAAQQASGSTQQVWAINAINQALQNLSETTNDISRRTDQLAQMGNQVLQRRAEISPAQIDSIIAYITRSVRDISVASRQQSSTYERMTGAMQAVMEVAEQVAGDSQQTAENASRLEQVVHQLRQLVGVNRRALAMSAPESNDGAPRGGTMTNLGGTVQVVRPPQRARRSGRLVMPASRDSQQMVPPHADEQPGANRKLGARPASDMGTGGFNPHAGANHGGGGYGGQAGPARPDWMAQAQPARIASPFGQQGYGGDGTHQPMGGPNSGPGGPPPWAQGATARNGNGTAWNAPAAVQGARGAGMGQDGHGVSPFSGPIDRGAAGLPPIDGFGSPQDVNGSAQFPWSRRE